MKRHIYCGRGIHHSACRPSALRSRGSGALRRRRPVTRVMAPRFEVDPFWPKPLPNHWLLGSAIGCLGRRAGPRLDDPSWCRQPESRRKRPRRQTECCRPRRRSSNSIPAGNLARTAGADLGEATTGRPRITVSRSITRERLDRRQRSGRLAHREVHAGTESSSAQYGKPNARQAGPDRQRAADLSGRTATTLTTSVASPRSLSTPAANEALPLRRLLQPARRRRSTRAPAAASATGAPTATSPTTPTSASTIRTRRLRTVPQSRCTAPTRRTTVLSTSVTASTIASRSSARTARSSRSCSSRRTPRRAGSVWDIAFSKDPQQRTSISPTARTIASTSSSARRSQSSDELRQTAAA